MLRYLALFHGGKSPLPSGETFLLRVLPYSHAHSRCKFWVPSRWSGQASPAVRGWNGEQLSPGAVISPVTMSGSGRPTPLSQGAPHGSSLKERDHREASPLPLAHRECAKGHCFEDVPYSLAALYLLSSA